MSSTQSMTIGLTVYFFFVFMAVAIASAGGLFDAGTVVTTGSITELEYNLNQSQIAGTTDLFSWGDFFKNIFSFFVFNINIYSGDAILMQYFWLIRLILVYIPGVMLLYSLYYSIRGI